VHGLCRGNGGGATDAGVALHEVQNALPSVGGRLPPAVIQDIVRGNYSEFRDCYEEGLKRDPNLRGRVLVRFIIDRNGRVSNVDDGGSTIPDREVVRCVAKGYSKLCFPPPEGDGTVTVEYPIMFAPGP
jgi:hypothetical protein